MKVAVVGAGPAGLMAAQALAGKGLAVELFDAMPSAGRKFLLAGRGGLNLTHSEPFDLFASRYGARRRQLEPMLRDFGAIQMRAWADELGIATFVGSSGRVFPCGMKAAPLLRAWLQRLRAAGVQFSMRHRWTGWNAQGALQFETPAALRTVAADATILALGGASWPRFGSTGAWVEILEQAAVKVAPLAPANCGFDVPGGWSPYFAQRFAGQPFKSVAIRIPAGSGGGFCRKGEFVATASGVEGSLVYAASALLRDQIAAQGSATFFLDLLPDKTPQQVQAEVAHPRGSRSLASHLKSRLGLEGIKLSILHERIAPDALADPARLAVFIQSLPIEVDAARPIDEAISSAGGVSFDAMDEQLMLRQRPGVFCAGEMLDWEAPTGGYLLTACMASGRRAGEEAAQWLRQRVANPPPVCR